MLQVATARSVPKNVTATDQPLTTEALNQLDSATKKAAQLAGFKAKAGDVAVLRDGESSRLLVGLGDETKLDLRVVRRAAASLARNLKHHKRAATNLGVVAGDLIGDRSEAIAAVVEGARLASYEFSSYKEAGTQLERLVIVDPDGRKHSGVVGRSNAVCDAVNLARDLVNEPGGALTPSVFGARAKEIGAASDLKVSVWTLARIRRERLGGLLAVNQGSEEEPRFLRIEYSPSGRNRQSVALVGKGITFDSGGLNIKNFAGMKLMKIDMAGAAVTLATMSALSALKVKVNVVGYIPLTDNMTGGNAQRPGDVFVARNGKRVEVLNTDAEGRLVLADALSLASEDGHDAIIDIATLTGSTTVALGSQYAAVMSNNKELSEHLLDSAAKAGENLWPLPLPDEYRSELESNVADLKNIGSGSFGGALIAGLFLAEFVDAAAWAHIDLGISAHSDSDSGLNRKGATGNTVRLLLQALTDWQPLS